MIEDFEKIPQALQSLRPKAEWHLANGTDLEWLDNKQTEPTKAEIDAEVIRLEKEFSDNEYARKRQAEYPSIQECVHAILDDDLTALQEKRQTVKNKYPKG